MKLSVFLGSTCDGSADVEGTIKAEFVGMVHRGECVVLNIPNWPDKYIKFERGIKGLKGVLCTPGGWSMSALEGTGTVDSPGQAEALVCVVVCVCV